MTLAACIGEYGQLHNKIRQTGAQWNTGKCSTSKSGGVSAPAWDTLFALWVWASFYFVEGEAYAEDIEAVAAETCDDIFSIGFRPTSSFTFNQLVKASGLALPKYAGEHKLSKITVEKWMSCKQFKISWDALFSLWIPPDMQRAALVWIFT